MAWRNGILMDHHWRSEYPHLVQTVAITSYTTFYTTQLVVSHDFFEDDLMVLLLKAFDTSISLLSDDWPFCGLNICWWIPAVVFVFDAAWSLLNSSLVTTSFLTKAWSWWVNYTTDLAFALANFSWISSLSAWFSSSCLFSRNSASAIILASLTFSSRALSLEDLLLLDVVLLELSELVTLILSLKAS